MCAVLRNKEGGRDQGAGWSLGWAGESVPKKRGFFGETAVVALLSGPKRSAVYSSGSRPAIGTLRSEVR